MDIRLCDKCELFNCCLLKCVHQLGSGVCCVTFVIVAECDGNVVAAEPVGKSQITDSRLTAIEQTMTHVGECDMPDAVKEDYDGAIERIVAKLMKVNDFRNCKYMTEQMVLDFNEEE